MRKFLNGCNLDIELVLKKMRVDEFGFLVDYELFIVTRDIEIRLVCKFVNVEF